MKIFPIMALVGFLAALETAIPAWRKSAPVSDAPVFSLPMMDAAMQNPGEFQRSIDVYQADRGGELQLPGPDGTSLTLFYFEWDQVAANPLTEIAGHPPEHCNVSLGYTYQGQNNDRHFERNGHSPLIFDSTTFLDPAGNVVYIYKLAWIQGIGSWNIREGHRSSRLGKSFRFGRGAARVVECGISSARDETHAWQAFEDQILQQLTWSSNHL